MMTMMWGPRQTKRVRMGLSGVSILLALITSGVLAPAARTSAARPGGARTAAVATAAPAIPTAVTAASGSGLTVPTVERQLLAVVSQVENASPVTSTGTGGGASQLTALGGLAAQLQNAESLNRQIANGNEGLAVLLQSKVDAQAAIDKIASSSS